MKDDDMKPYKDIAILQRENADLNQTIIDRDKEIAKLKEKLKIEKYATKKALRFCLSMQDIDEEIMNITISQFYEKHKALSKLKDKS